MSEKLTCVECLQLMSLNRFIKKSSTKLGYMKKCANCYNKIQKSDDNLTLKICKRHGPLEIQDIGLKIIRNIDPVSVVTQCLKCTKERIEKRIRENGRFFINAAELLLVCTTCKLELMPSDFNKSELKKTTAFRCKNCISLYNSETNKKKTQIQFRAYRLRTKYNLTYKQYDQLLLSQNNLCKICNRNEVKLRPKDNLPYDLSVDHCHKTGTIRGLLCKKCNLMLGNSNDSSDTLRKAADYLDKSNENA